MSSETNQPVAPTLSDLAILEGEWEMILSNASFMEDATASFESPASFVWIKQGAYMLMIQGDEAGPQFAYWMIGRDELEQEYTVQYSDARGVSRVYKMSLGDGAWTIWRQAPGFHQRFTSELSQDSNSITGQWEKSEDGENWQHDFDLTYRRKASQ